MKKIIIIISIAVIIGIIGYLIYTQMSKPKTPTDTRTPEQISADAAAAQKAATAGALGAAAGSVITALITSLENKKPTTYKA